MTNPQSRRNQTVEVTSDPSISSWYLTQIEKHIRQHEIRIAISSSLVGIPLLTYILVQIHLIKSHLGL